MTVYKLYCDDAVALITGDTPIPRLDEAVRQALISLPDRHVVNPITDWFESLVDQVCRETGYRRLSPDDVLYVEDLYFEEYRRREEEEPT